MKSDLHDKIKLKERESQIGWMITLVCYIEVCVEIGVKSILKVVSGYDPSEGGRRGSDVAG